MNIVTGTMKTLKKVGWESSLSHRSFFMFSPDALHPVGGNKIAAGPCAAVLQPIRNIAFCFYQEISACHKHQRRIVS